jgi:two-component system chemotaxis sensor kinase CheA
MSVDLKRFHATFFAESYKGLDRMEADLLRLERDGADEELLNSIFRAVHSVKGSGGSLGFREIAEFSHELESVLDEIRKGRSSVTPRTSELLLSALDCLRSLLRDAERERPPDEARRTVMRDVLSELVDEAGPETSREAAESTSHEPARAAPGNRRIRISFRPHPRIFHSGNDPLRLFRALAELGEFEAKADLDGLPDLRHFDPECCYLTWTLELRTDAPREQVLDAFEWVKDECKLDYAELDASAAPEAGSAPLPQRRKLDRRQQERRVSGRRTADLGTQEQFATSIHVSTEKVDKLVNLVGELVINRTILRDLAENFSTSRLEQLTAALALLERNTRDLQESVMAVRMLPVSFVFGRFTRLVRDFCQSSGKRVDLQISGEQSELDKTVIEKLVDPLTHLVRNALSHGIEMPEVRRAAGKPEIATLALHAQHKGGSIEIHIRDDGQGLNFDKIRSRAIEQGLIAAGSEPDEAALTEVIFAPSFSTSDSVSDLSGRGVGLDVVRRNLASLGGNVEVISRHGEGATFVLRLPLTLAILDGMSVGVGSETYIIPLSFIIECIQPEPGQAKSISGRGAVFEVRGEYVPFIELGRLLNTGGAAGVDSGIVVVLEAEGKKVAMLVDSLLSQDQVVIKSLEANYRKVRYIAGAMIMGEGRVVLILDVNAVVRSVRD